MTARRSNGDQASERASEGGWPIGAPRKPYAPAAGRDWLLPLYDPFVSLIGGDSARKALLDQATIRSGHRILDIGCGTGTLVVLVKRLHPDVEVVGLDPDPRALARGSRKAERAAVSIQLDQGYSDELPYAAASFDRVFSSFMFHHLPPEAKVGTLLEVRRVLKPGGRFHMLDLAVPESRAHGFLAHLFHASQRLKDNVEGRILVLLREAGFADPKQVARRATLLGPLSYYEASVPTSEGGAGGA